MATGLVELVEMEEQVENLIKELNKMKETLDVPAKKQIDMRIHELRVFIIELNASYGIKKPSWWECIF